MFNPVRLLVGSRWNAPIRYRVEEGDASIAHAAAGTLLLPMQRDRLIRYLPSGARVAEIGVARGNFSAQVRSVCKPSFLALVDPWCEQDQTIYYADSNNAAQTDQEKRFHDVTRRFSSSAAGHECRVIRKFSVDAAAEFPDASFDWVFIDGNHSFEACLEDLRLWAPKVKADGLICGHDFAAHAAARKSKYGVVEAVGTFCGETGYVLAALTVEHFPTFVLAKSADSPVLARMRQLLLSYESFLIEIKDAPQAVFSHARILDNGRPRSALMSFDFTRRASS